MPHESLACQQRWNKRKINYRTAKETAHHRKTAVTGQAGNSLFFWLLLFFCFFLSCNLDNVGAVDDLLDAGGDGALQQAGVDCVRARDRCQAVAWHGARHKGAARQVHLQEGCVRWRGEGENKGQDAGFRKGRPCRGSRCRSGKNKNKRRNREMEMSRPLDDHHETSPASG